MSVNHTKSSRFSFCLPQLPCSVMTRGAVLVALVNNLFLLTDILLIVLLLNKLILLIQFKIRLLLKRVKVRWYIFPSSCIFSCTHQEYPMFEESKIRKKLASCMIPYLNQDIKAAQALTDIQVDGRNVQLKL